ncbi:MAG: hypothetical protein ACR2JC_18605 [Chloroflexota bacterium]
MEQLNPQVRRAGEGSEIEPHLYGYDEVWVPGAVLLCGVIPAAVLWGCPKLLRRIRR